MTDDLGQPQIDAVSHSNLVGALNRLRYRELDGLFVAQPQQQQNIAQPHFGFSIHGEEFVVAAQHFCEVFTDIPIAPLPNAPEMLLGLANLRGLLLPVYQLHDRLAAGAATRDRQSSPRKKIVLVVGKGERAIGLLVDALPVSLSLSLPAMTESQALPHPQVPGLARIYLLSERTVAQLLVERLPEQLLRMASANSS